MENIFKSREVSVVIGKPYNLVIESTTGQTIREGMTAVLSAKVFNVDTQAYEPASGFTFKWQRNEKPTEFNEKTGDTISITYADAVGGNATFTCVASSADWSGTAYIMMSENAPGWSTARLILYKESEAIPDGYDGSNIEYTFADGSYNPTNPTLGFGTWKKDKPNTELPVYAIYNNVQSQTETAIAEASNWTTPEKISADSAKGLKIISPTAVFDTSSRGYVTKDIELRFQCKATNSDKPISWSVLPIDKYIDYTSEGLGASGNNNEFFTIRILRKYNGRNIDISAQIESDNLFDKATVVKNAPTDGIIDIGLINNVSRFEDLPNNNNLDQDPFVIYNVGPLKDFDHLTWLNPVPSRDENGKELFTQEVLYFKRKPDSVLGEWLSIDLLEKDQDFSALNDSSLMGNILLSGLAGLQANPNTKYESSVMNLFVSNLVANYIASNHIDSRRYHLIDNAASRGIIYGGDCKLDKDNNPVLPDTSKHGFFIKSDGNSQFNGLSAYNMTIDNKSSFRGVIETPVFTTLIEDATGSSIVIDESCIDTSKRYNVGEYCDTLKLYYPWVDGKSYPASGWFNNGLSSNYGYNIDRVDCKTTEFGKGYYLHGKSGILSKNLIVDPDYNYFSDRRISWYSDNPSGYVPSPSKKYGQIRKLKIDGVNSSNSKLYELTEPTTLTLTSFNSQGVYSREITGVKYIECSLYLQVYDIHRNLIEDLTHVFVNDVNLSSVELTRKKGIYCSNLLPTNEGMSIGSLNNKFDVIWSNRINSLETESNWIQYVNLASNQKERSTFTITPMYHYSEFSKANGTEMMCAWMLWKLHYDFIGWTNINFVGTWTISSNWMVMGYVPDLDDLVNVDVGSESFPMVRNGGFIAFDSESSSTCRFGTKNGSWFFKWI